MTCATCRHATRPTEPAMRGWVHCALERAPWHYLMPESVCHFKPSRWEIRL
ncbi:MAG: hypothetical protein Q8O33_12875 [Pseudomonadota bacterium]|nr:hypothetical protein [Pseudomonadota bacterium]